MRNMKCSALGRNTFLISFLSGTLLLVAYMITKADFLPILGFYFLIIAAIVNMLILLYELLEFLTDVSDRRTSGNSVILLLVNVPITILYLFIVFNLNL